MTLSSIILTLFFSLDGNRFWQPGSHCLCHLTASSPRLMSTRSVTWCWLLPTSASIRAAAKPRPRTSLRSSAPCAAVIYWSEEGSAHVAAIFISGDVRSTHAHPVRTAWLLFISIVYGIISNHHYSSSCHCTINWVEFLSSVLISFVISFFIFATLSIVYHYTLRHNVHSTQFINRVC